MGAAHCTIVNQCERPLCVLTFNMPDLVYASYHTMYIVDPGDAQVVEANPDAIGLKVGVLFDARRAKNEFLFHRFTCSNDSVLTITSVSGDDIDYYGENTQLAGRHTLRETDLNAFNLAASTLQVELARETDRPVNQAVQDVKRFVRSVKTKSEDVITKVTGKEISLDLPKGPHFPGAVTKAGTQVARPSAEDSSAHGDFYGNASSQHGSGSASTHGVGLHLSRPSSSATMNSTQKAPYSAAPSSSMPASSSANNGLPPLPRNENKPSTATTSANTNATVTAAGVSASTVSTERPSQSPTREEDSRAAQERWEAELERLKKEKKWEEEVERVRRERQQRAELEEEMRRHPERFAPPPLPVDTVPPTPEPRGILKATESQSATRTAPVADTGCSVCIVS